MGSRHEDFDGTLKKPWGAALLAALTLGFAGDAEAQSAPRGTVQPYNTYSGLSPLEEGRQYDESQRRAREGKMSSECREIIAITRGQIQRGEYPELLDEEVSFCSMPIYQELLALDRARNRRGNGDEPADRAR